MATAQANGPPPKVVPCNPGCIPLAATRSVVRMAPSGNPAANGLATVTIPALSRNADMRSIGQSSEARLEFHPPSIERRYVRELSLASAKIPG